TRETYPLRGRAFATRAGVTETRLTHARDPDEHDDRPHVVSFVLPSVVFALPSHNPPPEPRVIATWCRNSTWGSAVSTPSTQCSSAVTPQLGCPTPRNVEGSEDNMKKSARST